MGKGDRGREGENLVGVDVRGDGRRWNFGSR